MTAYWVLGMCDLCTDTLHYFLYWFELAITLVLAEENGSHGGEAEAGLKSGCAGEECAAAGGCDQETAAGSSGQPPERKGPGACS